MAALLYLQGAAAAQPAVKPLSKAILATELPMGAWGTYSRTHSGPCYLAQRFPFQLLSFPLVIGQKRIERVREYVIGPDGKRRLTASDAVVRRRTIGLSPSHAEGDDAVGRSDASSPNRRAAILDADAEGLLWRHAAHFLESPLSQSVSVLPDATGIPQKPAPWGEADVEVECFPAFVEGSADGLIIRIQLKNRSSFVENWYVDLLEGIDTITEQLLPSDLALQPSNQSGCIVLKHPHLDQAFAIGTLDRSSSLQMESVDNRYFSEEADQERIVSGKSSPAGLVKPESSPDPKSGLWGLLRQDDIAVDIGQDRVVWLCVGVGKDADAALTSVRTLLRLVEDSPPGSKVSRVGAHTQAIAAHEKARYASGDAVIDQLMSQTIANIPCNSSRRLGSPSRLTPGGAVYSPEVGGYDALAWSVYRPDWSASQLNSWFATLSDPNAPLSKAHARASVDLFALWQLYQETGSEELLKRVYPHARHRYLEMVNGCRVAEGSWLFGFPIVAPQASDASVKAPDPSAACSAWIIASSSLLTRIGSVIGAGPVELKEYADNRDRASEALCKQLWVDQTPSFVSAGAAPTAYSLTALLPLLGGPDSIGTERCKLLLDRLKDPSEFWSPFGLRSESKRSPAFNGADLVHGGINFGTNWMLWQALLDLGETEIAAKLAENLLTAYRKSAGVGPFVVHGQWLNSDTGLSLGVLDWSGDAAALIWLQSAYHSKGSVKAGTGIAIMDHHYDPATDVTRIVAKPLTETTPRITIIAVMGKVHGEYDVVGDISQHVKADASGVVTLSIPARTVTMQFTISPTGATSR